MLRRSLEVESGWRREIGSWTRASRTVGLIQRDWTSSFGIAEVVRVMRGGEVLGSHLDDAVPILVRQRQEGVVNYQ